MHFWHKCRPKKRGHRRSARPRTVFLQSRRQSTASFGLRENSQVTRLLSTFVTIRMTFRDWVGSLSVLEILRFARVRSTISDRSGPDVSFGYPPLNGALFLPLSAKWHSHSPTCFEFVHSSIEGRNFCPYGKLWRLFFLRKGTEAVLR